MTAAVNQFANGIDKRIGIIAGGGTLPGEVANSVVARGGSVVIVAVEGTEATGISQFSPVTVNWARVGSAIRIFKKAGVRDVVILGSFRLPGLLSAKPDATFFAILPAVLRILRAGGDDAVLRGLIKLLEGNGLRIIGAGDAAPELLIGEGLITGPEPSPQNRQDAALGFALIRALGQFDIGQAAVVSDGKIIAIEGVEGTDRMLQRVRDLKSGRGGVIVKRPKPGQELRIDLPTIGPKTVENAKAAGLDGVAVLANNVLVADKGTLIATARTTDLFVAGFRDDGEGPAKSHPDLYFDELESFPRRQWGRQGLVLRDREDAKRAANILMALDEFATGTAVVVRKKRVLAVGVSDTAEAALSRVIRKTGLRKRGVAAVRHLSVAVADAAVSAGLSAVVATNSFEPDAVTRAWFGRLAVAKVFTRKPL